MLGEHNEATASTALFEDAMMKKGELAVGRSRYIYHRYNTSK